MNLARNVCLLAAVVVAASVITSSAQAQYDGGCGWGGGWPYNFQSGIYGRTNAYVLPYFTLHPPVYYSYVVPRPYGFSPFAAPPGMVPAEMQVLPTAEVIENPHFQPGDEKPDEEKAGEEKPDEKKPGAVKPGPPKVIPKKTIGRTISAQRVIVNPYYRGGAL